MTKTNLTFLQTILLVALLSLNGCKKDDSSSSNQIGDIAYCFQNPSGNPYHQLYTINQDGTSNKKLINSAMGLNHHDWSPDGKKFATVGYVNMNYTWSIYTFNVDGTGLTRLTNTTNVWDCEPVWSHDGSKIAFTRIITAQNNKNEIWVMNADGSDLHYINIDGFQPKWSPDDSKFTYSINKTDEWQIYTCNVDGTNEQRITNSSAGDFNPIWSPDGSKIAFASERDGNYEIYVMNSDGSQQQRLTTNSVYDGVPKWSPDGSKIAYSSELAGNQKTEVYVMNADGSNITRVTHSSGSATSINPVWNPTLK